jgi:hypothetical protein
MSAHGPEHEELLARVLAGEIDPADPAVRDRLATCPECRREQERVGGLTARLRATAAQERADLARAAAEVGAEDEARVREAFARALRTRPAKRRSALLLVAAAVLVLLGWVLRGAAREDDEVLLGEGDIEIHVADDFSQIQWSYSLPPGGRYVLTIHELEDGAHGRVVLSPELEALDTSRWRPSAAQLESLPDAIYVLVEAYRAGEEDRIAYGGQEASR